MMEIMALEPEPELVLDDNAGAVEIAAAQDDNEEDDLSFRLSKLCVKRVCISKCNSGLEAL